MLYVASLLFHSTKLAVINLSESQEKEWIDRIDDDEEEGEEEEEEEDGFKQNACDSPSPNSHLLIQLLDSVLFLN